MFVQDEMEGQNHLTPPAPPFCPQGQLYTVMAGDSLFLIAQRFGVSLEALIAANPQIANPDLIFPGQVICVPPVMTPPVPPVPSCPGATYIVVQGDTLFQIARRFGVTLEALLAVNPQITNPDLIFPGQVICLPVAGEVLCLTGLTYMVAPGDTLFSIAQRFGVPVEALLRLNPQITDPDLIQPGQLLCVPVPGSVGSPIEEPVIEPVPSFPCPPREERPVPCPEPPVVSPSPCPPREKERYPSVPGTPMPDQYYSGSFVYAEPRVPWEECPYRPRRRRRLLCRRRRRL
ncbi:MAG TPA: LysM peptidoglycan-binding domain-containing protein [Capillibacterium sp.]